MLLHAIIIDDEPLAISAMKNKLQLFPNIQVTHTFTNVNKFLENYSSLNVDIIFLDIEMQGINGLDVAKQLKEIHPFLWIVFVTAHREYALQAFDSDGLDYLLKPVSSERLKKTIKRIEQYVSYYKSLKTDNWSIQEQLEVFYFNQFKVRYKGEWLTWRTEKTRELFAYFLFHLDEPIQRDFLIEILWPDSDINKGKAKLHTTISFLRKTLSEINLNHEIEYYNKCYIFKRITMKCDVSEFRNITENLPHNQSLNISEIERAIKLYKQGFLGQEDFSWAINDQSIYEEYFHNLLNLAIQYYEETQQEQAIPFYKVLIQSNPYQEQAVKNYICLLQKVGNLSEAQIIYDQYIHFLEKELGTEPTFFM